MNEDTMEKRINRVKLDNKNSEIAHLKKEIKSKDNEINELKELIRKIQAKHDNDIDGKNMTIFELRKIITVLEEELKDVSKEKPKKAKKTAAKRKGKKSKG